MVKSVRAKKTDGFIVSSLAAKCHSSSSVIIIASESAELLIVDRVGIEQVPLSTLGIAEVVGSTPTQSIFYHEGIMALN